MGFVISKFNSSVFIRQGQNGPVNILLYIDDLVIVNANLEEINSVKSLLAASFDMKDLGDLHYFLGIEVFRTLEGILINQWHYVLSMLFKFGMTECKSIASPLNRNVKFLPDSRMACVPKLYPAIISRQEITGYMQYVGLILPSASILSKQIFTCQNDDL